MSSAAFTKKETAVATKKTTAAADHTHSFQTSNVIDLPYAYTNYIVEQYKIFMRVQRLRYAAAAAAAANAAAASGANSSNNNAAASVVAPVSAQIEQDNALALSEWGALYEDCLTAAGAPVREVECASLWALATVMLQLHERPWGATGGAAPLPPGRLLQAWYCRFYMDPLFIQSYIRELTLEDLLSNTDEALDAAETLFLIGEFTLAAELLDVVHRLLYNTAEGRQLLENEIQTQETFEVLLRLLTVRFDCAASHKEWRAAADDAVHEGKDAFRLRLATGTPVATALNGLLTLVRHMLLIISGDDHILARRCKALHADMSEALFLFTSYCAIPAAYEPLERIAGLFEKALAVEFGEGGKGEWYHQIVHLLVRTQSVEDMAMVMSSVAEVAAAAFPWEPTALLVDSARAEEEEGGEDQPRDALGRPVPTPRQKSNKRFVLLAMAAHTADLCAPAIVAEAGLVELTFARNDLLTAYTRLFRGCERLWKVAGCYVVYAPLINPVEIYNVLVPAAVRAAGSTATYNALCSFVHRMLDANAPVQQELRRQLLARLGDRSTAEAWIAAVDHYRDRLFQEAHAYIIERRLAGGDGGWAAWLSVEVQQPQPLQWTLQARLVAASALEDELLLVVGESVQNGLLSLDTCPTTELLYSLRCCAALSVYRRAAAAVLPWQYFYAKDKQEGEQPQQQVFDQAAALQAAAWCLDALRDLLKRIDACDFNFHPETIFALVEHGADVVLALRRWLAAEGQPQPLCRSSAHLSEALLPLLTEALETTRIHQVKHREWMELRAPVLLEKLMRMVDTHLE